LDHVHDEAAVDYLDDKLGHPLLDPHGEEIPEDFVHLVPGAEVKAALLRDGRCGVVVAVGPKVRDMPLKVGTSITAGKREENGRLWTFATPSGQHVRLDHEQADSVLVRLQ
jgi:manganese/iron transport system permease protein/iron/zinc/copper transport system permease protein